MRQICVDRGVPHDIEWSEDKRLYGDAWYRFIGLCRAHLGSETGSNVFDFDGTVEAEYNRLAALRGGPVPYEEFRVHTDPIESQYDTGLISPRLFEAAALRTAMVLFTGRYSGLIEADKHYIELKKDFSNIDCVLARLEDVDGLERMTDRAFDRLIGSGEFSYRRFVELIDRTISRKAEELAITLRSARGDTRDHEIGADFTRLASFSEYPTKQPRHPVFFRYKLISQDKDLLTKENARLIQFYTKEITQLSNRYITEVAQLHDVYKKEIASHTSEIARLNHIYIPEIERLNRVIAEFHSRFRWFILVHKLFRASVMHLKTLVRLSRTWRARDVAIEKPRAHPPH
jgi:hypothetical protein